MFSNIDREMIADIFLGCKKNFDQTVDQLVNMGAEQEIKKPEPIASTPIVSAPTRSAPVVSPPVSPPFHHYEPLSKISNAEDPQESERNRLEVLGLGLSQEYRRLADIQESNLALDRQLTLKKVAIAAEQQKLEEERKALNEEREKFEEHQVSFQQDKKKLEDRLSTRLKEMKEEMRKSEEEVKAKEEENRRREEMAREERRRAEEEARQEEKVMRKEAKRALKEDKRINKQIALDVLRQERDALADKVTQLERIISDLQERNEGTEAHLVAANEEATESLAESLMSLSDIFAKHSADLRQKSISPNGLVSKLEKFLKEESL